MCKIQRRTGNGNRNANFSPFYTELSKTKQTQKPNLPTTQEIPKKTKPDQDKSTQGTPTTIKALQNKSTEKIRSWIMWIIMDDRYLSTLY
ncbi:unnamed protein product [Macrosiphum euphorbiae]|uniref:Uncharacterized protein n=1 Tax=Macrosiphum euphorbiae TaxID=13131 RepID=A0AAV0XH27_9HEMI|nr:unnamed protein product [Macrosiphum euphorbiae]